MAPMEPAPRTDTPLSGEPRPEQREHNGAGEGKCGREPQDVQHVTLSFRSQRRCRASGGVSGIEDQRQPTQTSAAAIARMKRNITCPSGWPQRAPAATKAKPARVEHDFDAHQR